MLTAVMQGLWPAVHLGLWHKKGGVVGRCVAEGREIACGVLGGGQRQVSPAAAQAHRLLELGRHAVQRAQDL